MRWRCYIEEYSPKLYYLKGKLNILADAFSRLPRFATLEDIEGKDPNAAGTAELLNAYQCLAEAELSGEYTEEMKNHFNRIQHYEPVDMYANLQQEAELFNCLK